MGELSAARQALEATELAPGTETTRAKLQEQRPMTMHRPMAEELRRFQPEIPVHLSYRLFVRNLRRARRGAAAGPSGMTTEHLRILLDDESDAKLLHSVCNSFAQADVPESSLRAFRLGRITALQKPIGGVRGIVAGDVVRRLVARTLAHQVGLEIEQACSPY